MGIAWRQSLSQPFCEPCYLVQESLFPEFSASYSFDQTFEVFDGRSPWVVCSFLKLEDEINYEGYRAEERLS
jgi:hypothetical protein